MFSTSRFQETVTCKGLFVLIHMFLLVTHSRKNFRVKVIVISPSKLNYISSSFDSLMMTGKTKCQNDDSTAFCLYCIQCLLLISSCIPFKPITMALLVAESFYEYFISLNYPERTCDVGLLFQTLWIREIE